MSRRRPPPPPPLATLIGLAADRFCALAAPGGTEPSPVVEGATCLEWARLAGLTGSTPHETIAERFPGSVDLGPYDPETVAHTTLQQLCSRGLVDRVGALPMQYRPRPDAVDRQIARRRPRRRRT